MKHGTYVGNREHLKGKTAILRFETIPGGLLAQFDDYTIHLFQNSVMDLVSY